jgi:hypothetical protein
MGIASNVSFTAADCTAAQVTAVKTAIAAIAEADRRFTVNVDGFDGDSQAFASTYNLTIVGNGIYNQQATDQFQDLLTAIAT